MLSVSNPFNFFKRKDKSLGLALGGGAARGIAHLGVLLALEEHGIKIGGISGVSSGSIVGGLYCAGVPIHTLIQELKTIKWRSFASFHLSKLGMVSSRGIERLIQSFVGDRLICECEIPFSTMATNLLTAQSIVFHNQDITLARSIRASASFPGVYSPVKIDGEYYVDGGASSNIPILGLDHLNVTAKVAVDVIPNLKIDKLPENLLHIVDRSLDILIHSQTKDLYQQSDLVISPIKKNFTSFDIKSYDKLIALGYQSIVENLSNIRSLL